MFFSKATMVRPKATMVHKDDALPGRAHRAWDMQPHFILGHPLEAPYPDHLCKVLFGMGCFWGAERKFGSLQGVYITAVGYAGGYTPHPTYAEVCSGRTGHSEVVLVVYDPSLVSFDTLLKMFWENHDPTQGMRQGNDVGTQYRSVIYVEDEDQIKQAQYSLDIYQVALKHAGHGVITTEIKQEQAFYFAENEHQQYLAKNPRGYCGLGGTGIVCPTGL
jgi:peptide-methionine (S)-S-oxide reductase